MNNSARTDPTESTTRKIKWLVVTIILLGTLGLGAYIYNFYGRSLSDSPERWGQFGDYLAGVLNPIFAFGALIALLWTIILQSKELADSRKALQMSAKALKRSKKIAARQAKHFEKQAKKEDVFRMINSVFHELHNIYSSSHHVSLNYWYAENSMTVVSAKLKEFFGQDRRNDIYFDELVKGGEADGEPNCAEVESLREALVELKDYLQLFERLSGDDVVSKYFRSRYKQVCSDMHEKAFIDDATAEYYKTGAISVSSEERAG